MLCQNPGVLNRTILFFLLLLSSTLILLGRSGLFFSLASIIILFGFQYVLQQYSVSYLPFPESKICCIEGKLKDEPVWCGEYSIRLSLHCDAATCSDGNSAKSDSDVTAYINKNKLKDPFLLGRGIPVIIEGQFSGEEGGAAAPVFNGKSIRVGTGSSCATLRLAILQAVRRKCSLLGRNTEILLPALVLGINHPARGEFVELFRKSGTAHIMALSGFHAGLAGIVLFLMGKLFFGNRGGYAFSIAGLLVFLWLAGMRPSLLRAVCMYCIFAWGKLTQRNFSGMNVLFFSYILTGFIDPLSLSSLSSQLSYLALAGIIISGMRLNHLLYPLIPGWLRLPLCTSLGAQLWTTFLVLKVFGVTFPAGLIASLVLTPLVTVYMYGGILWLSLPATSLSITLFRLLLGTMEGILVKVGTIFGNFPPIELIMHGPGPFLLLFIPVLLLEFHIPGAIIHGKRKTGFKL